LVEVILPLSYTQGAQDAVEAPVKKKYFLLSIDFVVELSYLDRRLMNQVFLREQVPYF
jgi:hypothetical protein